MVEEMCIVPGCSSGAKFHLQSPTQLVIFLFYFFKEMHTNSQYAIQ